MASDFMAAVLSHQAHAVIYSRETGSSSRTGRCDQPAAARVRPAAGGADRGRRGQWRVPGRDIRLAALAIGGIIGWSQVWYRSGTPEHPAGGRRCRRPGAGHGGLAQAGASQGLTAAKAVDSLITATSRRREAVAERRPHGRHRRRRHHGRGRGLRVRGRRLGTQVVRADAARAAVMRRRWSRPRPKACAPRQAGRRRVARATLARVDAVARLPEGLDLVIESVPERLPLCCRCWPRWPRALQLIATNTSALSVGRAGAGRSHAGPLPGHALFNPVWSLPLVELIVGADRARDRGRRTGARGLDRQDQHPRAQRARFRHQPARPDRLAGGHAHAAGRRGLGRGHRPRGGAGLPPSDRPAAPERHRRPGRAPGHRATLSQALGERWRRRACSRNWWPRHLGQKSGKGFFDWTTR